MVNKKRLYLSAAFILVLGVFAGLILSSHLGIMTPLPAKSLISSKSVDVLTQLSEAQSEVAAVATPSVVNISTTRVIRSREEAPFDHFDDPFFRRFFGDQFPHPSVPKEHKEQSLGSGVIVSDDGYIVTNNHVIEKAQEIKVLLSNKKDYKAKLIGADPKTDIAVIKIDVKGLAALPWGDSTRLKVGEVVFAIGNPFGLNQTVTMGMISAVGRANVGIADYEDFIQTDAAINPGNSGGALINAHGELIGINTAILSRTGGYQGIGFAVPSSMARQVIDSLVKYKKSRARLARREHPGSHLGPCRGIRRQGPEGRSRLRRDEEEPRGKSRYQAGRRDPPVQRKDRGGHGASQEHGVPDPSRRHDEDQGPAPEEGA
jgi:serine protease Do